MKKLSFLAALFLTLSFSINAQQTAQAPQKKEQGEHRMGGMNRPMPTAQEMADKETTRQTKMLSLTPDQVEKVKVINLKYCQQRADLMATMKQSNDRAGMETKMDAIRTGQDTELKTILTADQQAKLTKAHENMEERRSERKEDRKEGKKAKGQKSSDDKQ